MRLAQNDTLTIEQTIDVSSLTKEDTLIALSVCASHDERAALALSQLGKLRGCEAHSSVMLSSVDKSMFKKLGINLTCEPRNEVTE